MGLSPLSCVFLLARGSSFVEKLVLCAHHDHVRRLTLPPHVIRLIEAVEYDATYKNIHPSEWSLRLGS